MAIDNIPPLPFAVFQCKAFPPKFYRLGSSPSFIPPSQVPVTHPYDQQQHDTDK